MISVEIDDARDIADDIVNSHCSPATFGDLETLAACYLEALDVLAETRAAWIRASKRTALLSAEISALTAILDGLTKDIGEGMGQLD